MIIYNFYIIIFMLLLEFPHVNNSHVVFDNDDQCDNHSISYCTDSPLHATASM